MKRVIGLGGLFLKCHDTQKMTDWYRTHLGIDLTEWGAMFYHRDEPEPAEAYSLFSLFKESSPYFAPSEARFMVNFKVHDLGFLIEKLKEEGVELVGEPTDSEYGKFAWVLDPEGNKIELWQP